MTAVGKILVFMNLVFSVAIAGLIVMVFTARTNWRNEYEKVKNIALVAEAAYKSEKIGQNDVQSRDSVIKSQTDDLAAANKRTAESNAENDRIRGQNSKEKEDNTKSVANQEALAKEVVSLKEERVTLANEAQSLRGKVLEVQKDANDERLLAQTNRIEADTKTAQNRRLLDRVEELERNTTVLQNRLTALGGSSGGSGSSSLINPPPTPAPRDVKGTVLAANDKGQAVVNIGSDSGLSVGNKLFVYRIDPQNPPLYLGELRITYIQPKQAAGVFDAKSFAKPTERMVRVNDQVSTSMGSR